MLTSSDGESSPKLEEILSAELAVRPKVSKLKDVMLFSSDRESSPKLKEIFPAELAVRPKVSRLEALPPQMGSPVLSWRRASQQSWLSDPR